MKNMDIETVCAEFGTASFRARFSPEVNNFVELTNLRTGDNYMKQSPAYPVIELYGLEGKEKKQLMPGVPCVTVRDQRMRLVYDSFGGLPIAANLICTAEADRLTIHISVENHSNMDIVEVLAPHIGGIYLGNTYEDDTIIYPHHAGERTVNPVLGYGQNKKDFWRASSVACGDFFRREINYCGLASMSWMYYYDCENGLYVGSHDQRFPVTGIIAETSGVSEHPWMAFGFRKTSPYSSGRSV